jgi:hypothetical protein
MTPSQRAKKKLLRRVRAGGSSRPRTEPDTTRTLCLLLNRMAARVGVAVDMDTRVRVAPDGSTLKRTGTMGSSLATLVDNMAAETMALPETAPASAQEESSKKVDEDAKSPTFLSFKSPTTWLSGNGVSQRSSGVIAPVLKHEYDSVRVPGCLPFEIDCALDVEGQHTISWKSDIQLAGSAPLPSANGRGKRSSLAETPCLPVGKCNLYTFPSVTKTVCEEDGKIKELTYRPTGDQLKALCLLVKTLAVSEDIDMTEQPDEVGAFPMHALVVSNDEMALELAVEIFEARPELLTRVHTTHRNGLPLFVGESFLHILCVNSQEAMLLTLLELSMRELTTAQVETLLHSQAHGVFFHDHPMVMYGGTALSYACVFDLRRAANKMLDSGLVTLNDPSSRCKLTGFLPVHAVTANGLRKTLAWMTEELPIEDRADVRAFTTVGQLNSLELHSLQSLQLSAKLGNQRMFKDILRKHTELPSARRRRRRRRSHRRGRLATKECSLPLARSPPSLPPSYPSHCQPSDAPHGDPTRDAPLLQADSARFSGSGARSLSTGSISMGSTRRAAARAT